MCLSYGVYARGSLGPEEGRGTAVYGEWRQETGVAGRAFFRFRRPMLYPLSYGRVRPPRETGRSTKVRRGRRCVGDASTVGNCWVSGLASKGVGERRDLNPRSPGPQPGALTAWPRSPRYATILAPDLGLVNEGRSGPGGGGGGEGPATNRRRRARMDCLR